MSSSRATPDPAHQGRHEQQVELSTRAQRDLRKIGSSAARDQLVGALRTNLVANPMPENADAMRFQRAAPWLRLRSGDYRVTYRPLTASELQTLGVARGRAGFLVARIVDRRELDEAVAKL